jgi:hypothetical protein
MPLTSARKLRAYHDELLFIAAYPDDREIAALVDAELQRAASIAVSLMARNRGASVLHGSGLAGTRIEASFSIDSIRWLVHRFPLSVEIAWEEGSAGQRLDDLLAVCISRVEVDGLVGGAHYTQDWLRLARGEAYPTDLSFLLHQLDGLHCSADALDLIFDGLSLRIHWMLADPSISRSFLRFPPRRTFYQKGALRRGFSLVNIVRRGLPEPPRLASRGVDELLGIARASLLVRHRETDPVTYANPREITLFSLERGVDVALFGMQPLRRLPIESFFGYVLARNRVPVAYGGAWIFFDQAEIGINTFEEYRGGESAFLFAQVIRVYHQHFGVRRFIVDPYQIGADNPEAIRSGAYWFYDRLGFRSVEPVLRELADRERQRLAAGRGARTPAATLRRLARSDLALDLAPGRSADVPDLHSIGLAVTQALARRFRGDHDRAERWARRRIARLLGTNRIERWSDVERRGFDMLSVLIALLPRLEEWSPAEKRALRAMMRAKHGPRERDYVLRLRRHRKLCEALSEFAGTPVG